MTTATEVKGILESMAGQVVREIKAETIHRPDGVDQHYLTICVGDDVDGSEISISGVSGDNLLIEINGETLEAETIAELAAERS